MSESRMVPFRTTDLRPEAPGIASRAIAVNGVRWAVVEYGPGVLREEWCEEGHSGFVLAGEIEYEFQSPDHAALALREGDGFTLAEGTGHRGRSGAHGVRLFLIDREG